MDDEATTYRQYTESREGHKGEYETNMPCCGRVVRARMGDEWAFCCHCRTLYRLVMLVEEGAWDDESEPSVAALFTEECSQVPAALHRKA